jgi:hypothetical protein
VSASHRKKRNGSFMMVSRKQVKQRGGRSVSAK